MKLKEFRKKLEELTPQELEMMHKNSVEELFNLRFQLSTGHLEDKSKVRQIKRNLARTKTIMQERKDGSFQRKRSNS